MFSQINCKLTIIHTFHLPSLLQYTAEGSHQQGGITHGTLHDFAQTRRQMPPDPLR
nr:MAG TPA: hypothetical protein [Caudoviricetes sp.]